MKQMKTNIWLTIKNTEKNFTFVKYFETEYEKDKYKRKVKYIPNLRLIEDSTDIDWNYTQKEGETMPCGKGRGGKRR